MILNQEQTRENKLTLEQRQGANHELFSFNRRLNVIPSLNDEQLPLDITSLEDIMKLGLINAQRFLRAYELDGIDTNDLLEMKMAIARFLCVPDECVGIID